MAYCQSCPNRWIADLFEALGSTQKALEIRDAGCEWWWRVEGVQGKNGQKEVREGCGRDMLPAFLNAYGSDILLAADTIQEDRKEQRQALETVASTAAALGGGAAVQALAALGLRSYIAHRRSLPLSDAKGQSAELIHDEIAVKPVNGGGLKTLEAGMGSAPAPDGNAGLCAGGDAAENALVGLEIGGGYGTAGRVGSDDRFDLGAHGPLANRDHGGKHGDGGEDENEGDEESAGAHV